MINSLPQRKNLYYKNLARIPFNIYCLYNAVAEAYSRDEPKFRDDLVSRPFIVELTKLFGAGKEIIDVGCGDGHISRLVSPFVKRTVGVDISGAMLSQAQIKSLFCKNVSFIRANFLNLTPVLINQKFDIALGVYAFCCVKSRNELDRAFENIYRILRQNGTAIIQIPDDNEQLSESHSDWIKESSYSIDEVGRLIKRKLKTVDNNWVNVARYHFRQIDYLESIKKAGFKVKDILEPKAAPELLIKYPSLKHESEISSSLIFILQK